MNIMSFPYIQIGKVGLKSKTLGSLKLGFNISKLNMRNGQNSSFPQPIQIARPDRPIVGGTDDAEAL